MVLNSSQLQRLAATDALDAGAGLIVNSVSVFDANGVVTLPALPSIGGVQGLRFGDTYGNYGNMQAWTIGQTVDDINVMFFNVNRYYNPVDGWYALNARAAAVFQVTDTDFTVYNFPAGSNIFTVRLTMDQAENVNLATGALQVAGNQVVGTRLTRREVLLAQPVKRASTRAPQQHKQTSS